MKFLSIQKCIFFGPEWMMRLLDVVVGTNVQLHGTKNSWLSYEANNLPIIGLNTRTSKLTCREYGIAKISELIRGHVQRLVLACVVVVNVIWPMDLPNHQRLDCSTSKGVCHWFHQPWVWSKSYSMLMILAQFLFWFWMTVREGICETWIFYWNQRCYSWKIKTLANSSVQITCDWIGYEVARRCERYQRSTTRN